MDITNLPSGSVTTQVRMETIAAQLNVAVDSVCVAVIGGNTGKARFLWDEALQRTWTIPFETPKNLVIETLIGGVLNGKYQLNPANQVPADYFYVWGASYQEGVWIRTNNDLAWHEADGCWYRYVKEITEPFITDGLSPRVTGNIFTPENQAGEWEDMGTSGMGANFKGEPGANGTNGEDGEPGVGVLSISGKTSFVSDLPYPPVPPSYDSNPNALFSVSMGITETTLLPGVPVTLSISVKDIATGKPVDVVSGGIGVRILSGTGTVTTPVGVKDKPGEYTVKVSATSGAAITYGAFITDIYMHNSDLTRRILQLERTYRFDMVSTPTVMEVGGTDCSVALEVTTIATGEPVDIPQSTIGITVLGGPGNIIGLTKTGVGTYSATLKGTGEEGSVFIAATVNEGLINTSRLIVPVVPEFAGRFWEAKMHSEADGSILIPIKALTEVAPADAVIYVNGVKAVYKAPNTATNTTVGIYARYTAPSILLNELNTVIITGSVVVYWSPNMAEINRIGTGVSAIDCAYWGMTTGGLIPKFTCGLPPTITNLDYAFQLCTLPSIDGIADWDTSKVTSMAFTFAGYVNGLGSGSVSSYRIPGASNRSRTPSAILDIPNWDCSNVLNVSYMFGATDGLNTGDISLLDGAAKVINATGVFQQASDLNIKYAFNWPDCTSGMGMFKGVRGMSNIDITGSVLSGLRSIEGMFDMTGVSTGLVNITAQGIEFTEATSASKFVYGANLDIVDLTNCAFPKIGSGTGMFSPGTGNIGLNYTPILTGTQFPSLTSGRNMFWGLSKLTAAAVSGMKTPLLRDGSGMFSGCASVNLLEAGDIITGNLVEANNMFTRCAKLNTPLNKLDFSGLINARDMFSYCSTLNQPLTGIKFTKLVDAYNMFYSALEFNSPIDAGFPVLVTTGSMFASCVQFNQDISPLFVSGLVKNTDKMFEQCRTFNHPLPTKLLASIINGSDMFTGCGAFNQPLESIEFTQLTSAVQMFSFCGALNVSLVALQMPSLLDATRMFTSCVGLNTPLKGMTLPSVQNLTGMFLGCSNLNVNATVMYFPAASTAVSMFALPAGITSPRVLDVSGSKFPALISAQDMFNKQGAITLKMVDVEFDALTVGAPLMSFPTPAQVQLIFTGAKFPSLIVGDDMFKGFSVMADDFEGVQFPALASAKSMFMGCAAFKPTFKDAVFGSIENANGMFTGCTSLNVDIVPILSNTVVDMANMLNGCANFNQPIDGIWLKAKTLQGMLYGCSSFDQSLVDVVFPVATVASGMFQKCHTFNQPITAKTFPAVQYVASMLENATAFDSLITLDFSQINSAERMLRSCTAYNQPVDMDLGNVTSTVSMFYGCSLFNQPLDKLKLPKVLTASFMFAQCSAFNQPIVGLAIPMVTDLTGMFQGCVSLNQPVIGLSAPNGTLFNMMFSGCTTLDVVITLNLPSADTLVSMFRGCTALEDKAISITAPKAKDATTLMEGCTNFNAPFTLNAPNVLQLAGLFNKCTMFDTEPSINAKAAINMSMMFMDCRNFNKSLSKLVTSSCVNFHSMFSGCTVFNQPLSNWNVSSAGTYTNNTTTGMGSMFLSAKAFVQDISMWSVNHLPANMPGGFDSGTSALWTAAMKPQWGKAA